MILLIETRGFIAEVTESEVRLRNNRRDRDFWRQAAHIPLARWAAWRDERIASILAAVPRWIDAWSLPDGDYVLNAGPVETMAVRPGGQILFTLRPCADPIRPREVLWQNGEPCPVALTPRDVAGQWDGRAHQARMERLEELLGAWNVRAWWNDLERDAAGQLLALARQAKWMEALACLDNAIRSPDGSCAGLLNARRYVGTLAGATGDVND